MKALSKDKLKTLHMASCRILEEMGIFIRDEEALAILVEKGAHPEAGGLIKITSQSVNDAIACVTPYFDLWDRKGNKFQVGRGKHRHAAGGTMTEVYDWKCHKQRPALRNDLIKLIRLCDVLPLIDIVVPMVEPRNAAESKREIIGFAETFKNTTKHCLTAPLTYKSAQAWIEMGKVSSAKRENLKGHPTISLVAAIIPGLEIDPESAKIMVLSAKEGIPLVLMGSAMAGGQTPITIAGSVAMANAANLAALTLVQSINPGHPVFFYCGCQALDMRSGEIVNTGPESILGTQLMAQLAQSYRIPTYACTADTEAKTGDIQAGMEKMGGMLSAFSSGIDVTINAGTLNKAGVACPEQLIIDHDMLGFLDRLERGVEINDETLGLEAIKKVGPRGCFMDSDHTLKYLRSGEYTYLDVFDRSACRASYEDIYNRASDRCDKLLEEYGCEVPDEIQNRLDEYIKMYE